MNIQTHFQLEEHIVFLKMSKDLSVKYETKIRDQKYERKILNALQFVESYSFPFPGSFNFPFLDHSIDRTGHCTKEQVLLCNFKRHQTTGSERACRFSAPSGFIHF